MRALVKVFPQFFSLPTLTEASKRSASCQEDHRGSPL